MAGEFFAAYGAIVVARFCWESILKPVGRQFGYGFCYGSYVKDPEDLEDRVRELDTTIELVQQKLGPKERSGEEKTRLTREWGEVAESMSKKAKKLLSDAQGQVNKTRCSRSNYFLVNPWWRYWNSRKAYKMAQSVCDHAAKTYEPVLQNIVNLKNYIALDTRGLLVTRILETLGSKEGGRRIGVHGLPGVGKTTLVRAVTKQALQEGLFSDFVEVTVSQSPNLEKIQQDIGDRLGLKPFKAQGFKERAFELRERLKKEDKFLLVLDDVWNQLNLADIGIVLEHPGCRILLASRSKDVLQDKMDVRVEDTFAVSFLSESEALALFSNIVGDDTLFTADAKNSELNHLAIKIVEECARLLLAITTVAEALKHKPLHKWRDALRHLQRSSLHEGVNSVIKLSYDFLKIGGSDKEEGDQTQKIFLFCSLHEEDEDMSISCLLDLVIGWGLFQDDDRYDAATDRLQTLLDKLKSHGLLLNGADNDDSVKMHDVIHDSGISIAS